MENIRNIAVIAHVDHGKTTLIDALLKQTHTFRDNQREMQQKLILDSNELEKERGITILAKNCEVTYKSTRINIIDTPGHADFSGEVERTLGMADGALLIIDAKEGPMPQTRFVLRKALELKLQIIVLINKIDKPHADLEKTKKRIDDLFLELATEDSQLYFPTLYAIARDGKVYTTMPTDFDKPANTFPLLDAILEHISPPHNDANGPFKLVVTNLEYDNHLGRIIIGKIHSGRISKNDPVILTVDPNKTYTVARLFQWKGLGREDISSADAGNIVAIAGIHEVQIGQTLSAPTDLTTLPALSISEPTLHISISPNTSPLSGQEGEFTSSRQLEDRLMRELEHNLSLRVEKKEGFFKVSGRGELHLSILLETMRREGYEMEVGKPQVILKEIDGIRCEPLEEVSIIIPHEYQGVITQELGKRLSRPHRIEPISETEMELIFHIPSRITIGLRSLLLTLTRGTVMYNSQLIGWEKLGKQLPRLRRGAMIATKPGDAVAYGINAAQERGITFVEPGTRVYEGMIVGLSAKEDDMEINICKNKQLTNMRAAGSDDIIQLTPATIYSLEEALDFLEDDELLEITPKSLRLRKRYLTDIERRRHRRSPVELDS